MNQIIMKHQVTSREMKCDLPVNEAKKLLGQGFFWNFAEGAYG